MVSNTLWNVLLTKGAHLNMNSKSWGEKLTSGPRQSIRTAAVLAYQSPKAMGPD